MESNHEASQVRKCNIVYNMVQPLITMGRETHSRTQINVNVALTPERLVVDLPSRRMEG